MYVCSIYNMCIYIYQISLYKHTQKAEMKMAEGIFHHASCRFTGDDLSFCTRDMHFQ